VIEHRIYVINRNTPIDVMKVRSFLVYAKNYVLNAIANNITPPGRLKNWILRRTGADIHPTVFISPGVIIDPLFPELIHIDEGVFIGWGVRLFTHIVDATSTDSICVNIIPISIGKQAFIGGFTTIRPGVVIGANAIIGSDSLVNKDVRSSTKVWGVPASEH